MKQGPDKQRPGRGSAGIIGVSAGLGLAAGVVLGTALENLAVGMGLGLAAGIAFGVAVNQLDRQQDMVDAEVEDDQQRRTLIVSLLVGLTVLALVGLLVFYALS